MRSLEFVSTVIQRATGWALRALPGAATLVAGAGLIVMPLPGANAEDIILEPDVVVTGNVGLTGETFSNGSISAYTSAGNASGSFDANGEFTVSVAPGVPYRLYANMYNFQGTSNARLTHDIRNLPAIPAGDTRHVDLRRASGRIHGSVSVVGGTLERLELRASSSDPSVPEYFSGYAVSQDPASPAIQPMPVIPYSTSVYGTALARSDSGCSAVVSLPGKSVMVSEGQVHTVQWEIDVSGESCTEGTLQGRVELPGLAEADPSAMLRFHQVWASGPAYSSTQLTADGDYVLAELPEGRYSSQPYSLFEAPYFRLHFPYVSNIDIVGGEITHRDFIQAVGTASEVIELVGPWNSGDLADQYAGYSSSAGGVAYDMVDLATGHADLVLTSESWRSNYHQFRYWNPRPGRYVNGYVYFYPVAEWFAGPAQGEILNLGTRRIETAATNVSFVLAQSEGLPEVGITRLTISGSASLYDPDTGLYLGSSSVSLDSNLQSGGAPTPELNVNLKGLPGTYSMQASADGTDGRVYRKSFQLTLGNPEYTPEGTGVVKEFPSESGNDVTMTFDNVTSGGQTTVSEITIGPEAPEGFIIYGPGESEQKLYFDIVTSAEFDGSVEVCVKYDDTALRGNEGNLELGHYTCDDNLENCAWEQITTSRDTTNNVLCGVTDRFSIFAILDKLIIDTDEDGVIDEEDNCPLSPNPSQSDFDGDGIGDACDTDSDGDGIVNDEDLCPGLATQDNADLDGDGIGNPCDRDKDGDLVEDVADNCPYTANADQADFDGDGAGDACDIDDDEDYVLDSDDACPGTSPGASIDDAGCSSGQRLAAGCPVDADYRNHGEYVSCVVHEVESQVAIGLITSQEGGAITSTAAQSDIGKRTKD